MHPACHNDDELLLGSQLTRAAVVLPVAAGAFPIPELAYQTGSAHFVRCRLSLDPQVHQQFPGAALHERRSVFTGRLLGCVVLLAHRACARLFRSAQKEIRFYACKGHFDRSFCTARQKPGIAKRRDQKIGGRPSSLTTCWFAPAFVLRQRVRSASPVAIHGIA